MPTDHRVHLAVVFSRSRINHHHPIPHPQGPAVNVAGYDAAQSVERVHGGASRYIVGKINSHLTGIE